MAYRLLSLLVSVLCVLLGLPAAVTALPTGDEIQNVARTSGSTDKLVFAHFMIGIVSNRQSAADYDADFQRAKAVGIDAFALNIGTDSYTDTQLRYAYQSAANNDMKVFISFDFNWYTASQASDVGNKVKQYAGLPAQLTVDGKLFVSSFAGDGLDVTAMESAAGTSLYFVPNVHPGNNDFGAIDGALNWMAWDNNGNNKAPTPGQNVTVSDGDNSYISELNGKAYLAPASGWFSTHYGAEVSYSKNWVFPGDELWFKSWNDILTVSPNFVEIVTWNDYGESHYVAPLASPHTDDGASKWVMDMPHNGWLDMAAPFISAYKAGATSVNSYIAKDELIYWYRPTQRDIDCDATDNTMTSASNASGNFFEGRPDGYETLADSIFVVSLLTADATVQATSGGNAMQSFTAPAGANVFSLPMGVGAQTFSVVRDGQTVLNGTSAKEVVDSCICGIYNFNAYVGQLPAPSTVDALQSAGLALLTQGLKVTCPTNTLAADTGTATAAS